MDFQAGLVLRVLPVRVGRTYRQRRTRWLVWSIRFDRKRRSSGSQYGSRTIRTFRQQRTAGFAGASGMVDKPVLLEQRFERRVRCVGSHGSGGVQDRLDRDARANRVPPMVGHGGTQA